MNFKTLSLRLRIFLSMIFLVLLASVLMAAMAIYQYHQEANDYHQDRLKRKEKTIKDQIAYQLKTKTRYPINTKNIPLIFEEKNFIYELADVHNLEVKLYDLKGKFLVASNGSVEKKKDDIDNNISSKILSRIIQSNDKRFLNDSKVNNEIVKTSYSYITTEQNNAIAILEIPYIQDNKFITRELNAFLGRLALLYSVVLLIAIVLAYFLSKYITKSLNYISEKIYKTRLDKKNTKIEIENVSDEISGLVKSYNSMIDELQESAVKLATIEREQAWKEMAKQVAHEIKNPLTPMRLSIQNFQRKFDENDPNISLKAKEFSKTLIQQIDTMSSIAEAFSNFAKMPEQKNETLNVVEVIKLALDIFSEENIQFISSKEKIIATFDRTQLIRVITNLVKNSIQANATKINVTVNENEKMVHVVIEDNGVGINPENKLRIFEPKFTTKNSGMGLGLGMVKDIIKAYNGKISFVSEKHKGTTFTISLPKQNSLSQNFIK